MNAIGDRIRQLRKDAKLTQDELAERTGANRVTIANYELGKYQPSVEALERLADALGVSPDVITGRADKPEEKDEAWAILPYPFQGRRNRKTRTFAGRCRDDQGPRRRRRIERKKDGRRRISGILSPIPGRC